jgi:hypothetical protein
VIECVRACAPSASRKDALLFRLMLGSSLLPCSFLRCWQRVVGVGAGGTVDWRTIQILVRSMPGVHKHLVVASLVLLPRRRRRCVETGGCTTGSLEEGGIGKDGTSEYDDDGDDVHGAGYGELDDDEDDENRSSYEVRELVFTSEHAPFRAKHQNKRQRLLLLSNSSASAAVARSASLADATEDLAAAAASAAAAAAAAIVGGQSKRAPKRGGGTRRKAGG